MFCQTTACTPVPVHAVTEADKAYSEKHYADAESLYVAALAQRPKDVALTAALTHALLQQGKIAEASAQVNSILTDNPRSPAALTALAEVQLRQGFPWFAMQSLDAAQSADPCYARAHLVRSRVLRINSSYAAERAEIQSAFEIDPADPDIKSEWRNIVSSANELQSIDESLAAAKDLDAKVKQSATESVRSLRSRLSENSQTCQVLPAVASDTLPLLASIEDKKQHLYRYLLEVQLPQSKVKVVMDTAASGLYISRALAEQNNLHPAVGAPQNTVHADDVRIGLLEFHDCTLGVSDAPFPDKADGMIGTDMFASYLITLDFRSKRLALAPLPAQVNLLPGDRSTAPELKDFVPVYHRRQYLLVPVTVDKKWRQLFILGTGMPYTAMDAEAAHSVSNSKTNSTSLARTASGTKEAFYRHKFDLELAKVAPIQNRRIAEFDFSHIDQSAGFQVAGVLGLDILHSMVVHLDYRDGLVKFDVVDKELVPIRTSGTSSTIQM